MKATRRTRQSAQSPVPGGQLRKRVGLDGKAGKGSRGKVRAEIEAKGELPHTGDGRTEASGHKARGRKPKSRRLSEMRAAASCAPRENSRRSPREVDRQPPDHADNSRPTSKPAGTDEGPEAVAELFDDFLVFALAESDLWDVIASALPEELFDRIDRHVEALLAVPWEQGR